MELFLRYLLPFVVLAVAIVLLMGLVNLLRSGSSSRSQLLMRWRIGLQFAAVAIIMGIVSLAAM